MSLHARCAAWLIALALATVAGWRIVATRVADWLAPAEPSRALAWDAHNPHALQALAERQLQAGDPQRAAATARALLRTAPLQAEGFAVLARAAEAGGDEADAQRLFPLALRRAPRDQYVRAWVIGTQLHDGDYPAALHNITVLFGIASVHEAALLPLLTRVADHDPAFAVALGRFLAGQPRWRSAMLDDLLAHASLPAVDTIFGTLQATGTGLGDAEAGRWFARLEKDGRWGEAYSRWISRVGIAPGHSLPAVYNGGFDRAVTGIGFDWKMQGEPGVVVARTAMPGAAGSYAAAVTFQDRRADDIGFEQTLLLAPGNYRLTFRARAEDLRSDKGLQWNIVCADGGEPIASSPHLGGSFDWKTVSTDFAVPAAQCPAQRLTLVNPGAGGSGKVVSGQIWFDDFRVSPTPASAPSPPQAGR